MRYDKKKRQNKGHITFITVQNSVTKTECSLIDRTPAILVGNEVTVLARSCCD